MKKLFTSLALAAIAMCNLSANAEKATIYVLGYYTGIEAEVETDIVKLEDGSYSIPDFLGSGAPFSFKFTKPTESMKPDTNVEFTSPLEIDGEGFTPLTPDEDSLECKFESNGSTYYMFDPYVYTDGDTYIQWSKKGAIVNGWNDKQYDYEYDLSMLCDAYIATKPDVTDDDLDWVYIDIYFNGIGEENGETPEEPALTATLHMTTYDYYGDGKYTDVVMDTEIVKLEDGSYSIPDFLNSGAPFSFKFTRPYESMAKGKNVTITSPTEYDADYGIDYLLTPEEDYLECEYDVNGTKHYLFEPTVSSSTIQWSETGVIKFDGTNYDYEYLLSLEGDGYVVTDPNADLDDAFNYIWFDIFFNGIGDDPVEEPNEPSEPIGEGEEITVYIEDYDGNTVADPFVTTLIPNSDGSYTIADVMNSGEPMTFKFAEPAVYDWSDGIEITSPVDDSATYPYLLSADGEDYLYCTLYGYDGKEGATELNFPYVAPTYSYVYRYDTSDPKTSYAYYATICTSGFLADDTEVEWFYLDFYFNAATSGVNVIENNNAPVEYYNLNGVRVQNPSNGIFIRKQGADVKKVIIK